MSLYDQIPIPGVFLLTIALVVGSVECGFRLGRHCKGKSDDEPAGPTGEFVASTISLLAFMLAFTFGITGERFNDRRVLIIDEANAIDTTFLRSDFLPAEPARAVRNHLREYVDIRLELARNPDLLAEKLPRTQEIQREIWGKARDFGRENLNSDVGALFIESLNEAIELQASRLAHARARIPPTLWAVLFVLTVTSMLGMGYRCGAAGKRDWTTVIILSISFALVITVITDLDRPMEGLLKASQQPLIDLRQGMGAVERANPGRE